MPRKLGQHFLIDRPVLKFISEALGAAAGKTIIEIGPGHGELTEVLRQTYNNNPIIVIEKDGHLAEALLEFLGVKAGQIKIVHADALKELVVIVDRLTANKFKKTTYYLIGNIPYYISGKLFRAVYLLNKWPERAIFTVQEEVGKRMVSTPPRMNRLAASMQIWAAVKILKRLSPEAFKPPPKVRSVVIELIPHKTVDNKQFLEKYFQLVNVIFRQPRKTIFNNLRQSPLHIDNIGERLSRLGLSDDLRPQNLSIKDLIGLAKTFIS